MSTSIASLAQFVSLKKNSSRKFVLMLGAGASLSSGVQPTGRIIDDLVSRYAAAVPGASVDERFDALWRSAAADTRQQWLDAYLTARPSPGYRYLAEILAAGFIDVVITFNFDRLLETALDAIGFTDYRVIVRGEVEPGVMTRLAAAAAPRVRILKMHGSLRSADYFLFSKDEMLNYPPEIKDLIFELTGHDIIICGYAFNDLCVLKAFNDLKTGGSIHYVDPSGPGPNVRGYLLTRLSVPLAVSGEMGRFDNFFEALHGALTAPEPCGQQTAARRQNLFKFLDHYREEHKNWFFGRRKLTRALVRRFNETPPPVIFLNGLAKVGKTSFARAGLIPHLDAARFDTIYVRGTRDLEPHLRSVLGARLGTDLSSVPWPAIVGQLKASTTRHVVLILDQLERTARAWQETHDRQPEILQFVHALMAEAGPRFSIVGIGTEETAYLKLLLTLRVMETMEIRPLSARFVGRLIARAARTSQMPLPPGLIEEMCQGYQQTLDNPHDRRRYTLTHIQTVCYYLARGYHRSWAGYDRVQNQGFLAAMDSLRDEPNLIDLLDDLPASERRLIRSFLKVICDPGQNTRQIVEFITQHFPQIHDDHFPELIA